MFKEPAMFQDREAAGRALAARLVDYFAARQPSTAVDGATSKRKYSRPVVVAIPRGGMPLSSLVADELDADFDICLVRRIPGPTSTYGTSIAAVTEQGDILLSQPSSWGVSRKYMETARMNMLEDISRRRLLYATKPLNLRRRDVILVDDCIATGASMLAAIHSVKKQRPNRIIVASPYCSIEARQRLLGKCNDVVVLHIPSTFVACAQFYVNFHPVTDLDVLECLREQRDRILRRDQDGNETDDDESTPRNRRTESRATSPSLNSSCDEAETERKDDGLDDESFRVHRATSWAAAFDDEGSPMAKHAVQSGAEVIQEIDLEAARACSLVEQIVASSE